MDKKNKKPKLKLRKVGKTTVAELQAKERVKQLKKQIAEKRSTVKPVKFNKNMSLNELKKLKPQVKKYNDVLIAKLYDEMVATERLTRKYIISVMEQDSNEKLFASQKGGLEKKLSDSLRDIKGKNLEAKKVAYMNILIKRKANTMSGLSRIGALIRMKEKEAKEEEKQEKKNPKNTKGIDNPKTKENVERKPKPKSAPKKKRLNISLIMKMLAPRLRERDLLVNLIKKHGSKAKVMGLLEDFIIKRHEGDKSGFKDEEDVVVFFANRTNDQILKLI
jgi:hypothetical protein